MDIPDIVGKTYTFPDGVKLEVMQIKIRENVPFITCHIHGASIPRKTVMPLHIFMDKYGHLFELRDPPKFR